MPTFKIKTKWGFSRYWGGDGKKKREYQQRDSTTIPGNSYLYLESCAFKRFIESNHFLDMTFCVTGWPSQGKIHLMMMLLFQVAIIGRTNLSGYRIGNLTCSADIFILNLYCTPGFPKIKGRIFSPLIKLAQGSHLRNFNKERGAYRVRLI